MLYFTWILPLLLRYSIANFTFVTLNTKIISDSGSTQTYYLNHEALCTNHNRFNIEEISNLSTITVVYGSRSGDTVQLSFRPNQIIDPIGLTYTYVFTVQDWIDLATTQLLFNAPYYVDVPLNSSTTFKMMCGNVNASNVVLFGQPDINIFNGVCLSFRHYIPCRPGRELLFLRIVQEPDSLVAIYEVYSDIMVKRVFDDIRQITRLVFDMWSIQSSELIYLHLVKVVIKECHETMFANISNSHQSVIHHNYRFDSRVAIYEDYLCTTVTNIGLYDLLLPENFVLSDVLLVPSNVPTHTKEIAIKFYSRLTTTSVGIEKTLHFFEHNIQQLNKSLIKWNDYRISSSQHVIHFNVLADANCTMTFLGLNSESAISMFNTNEKVRISVNSTGTYARVQFSDFARFEINYDNYVPEKVMCISYRKPEEIFHLHEEFNLIVYKILKRCLPDI